MLEKENIVICGDALNETKKLPDASVDCVITSPPYWQLRDYGFAEQWGLEPTYDEYLTHLWGLMDEIFRILKDTGTVWINLGDTYSKTGLSGGNADKFPEKLSINRPKSEVKDKCLMLIPHRFAIGCIERGWIVRNDCVWAKRNGMPESVTDRLSKKHEYFFFFVKQKKYYFDLDGVREQHKAQSIARQKRAVSSNNKWVNGADGQTPHNLSQPRPNRTTKIPKDSAEMFGSPRARYHRGQPEGKNLRSPLEALDNGQGLHEKGKNPGDVSDFWDKYKKPSLEEYLELCKEYYLSEDDFFDIPTKPSSKKHYATFNTDLVDKPIIAGCPEGGIILDPFCGTGTTLARALQLNRKVIGIDGSADYCKIAEERIAENELRLAI